MPARIVLSAVALVLLAPVTAPAQSPQVPALDPEASTPILLRIVVQTSPHPLLGPAFRDGLRRDLLAALQPALGSLGTVEIIDLADVPAGSRDPLWQAFDEKGFAALDAPRDLTGTKTHFLRVEYRNGVYHLETRQLDGFAGVASPVVRKQSTRAPELVGRIAGLMIDRDTGMAGTIEAIPGTTSEVMVRFRAGKLGSLDRFVKEGDVFAVARIARSARRAAPPPIRTATGKIIAPPPGTVPPPAFTPEPLPYTLLRATDSPREGVVKCTVFTGYQTALKPTAGTVGFRCMKLGTAVSRLSVRLVGGDGTAAASSAANVRATEAGFDAPREPRDLLAFRDGLYRSGRPLSGLACVTVTLGATREAHFPVPVLGTEPVTLRFEVSPEAEAKAGFERAALAVSARASDARIAQTACFTAVAKLILAKKNPEALARAQAGFEAANAADQVMTEEVQQLKGQIGTAPGAAEFLTRIEQQLSALRLANGQLAARIKELESVVAKESDPKEVAREVQAQALNTRISLLIARGEIDEALTAYGELSTLLPGDATIPERRNKLTAEWKPKDAEQAQARDYLLKTWPALATIADLKESLPQLRSAVEVLKKHSDRHAIRGFLTVLGGMPAKLVGLVQNLDTNTDADRKTLTEVGDIRDVIAKLEQELLAGLKKEG